MTIQEFLLARITEHEERAYSYREVEPKTGPRFTWTLWPDTQETNLHFEDGSRKTMPWSEFQERHMELVLSRPHRQVEGAAWRAVVALHTGGHECPFEPAPGNDTAGWFSDNPCPTLRALARPYADHSDYRDEWRP